MKYTLFRIWGLYWEGFRNMSHLGRTLWFIILIKLLIIFLILKLLFFPNFLSRHSDGITKEEYVAGELTERSGR